MLSLDVRSGYAMTRSTRDLSFVVKFLIQISRDADVQVGKPFNNFVFKPQEGPKDNMFAALLVSVKAILSYVLVNLTCLLYGPQLLVSKSLILTGYVDLLVDLAETFGA